MCLQFTHLFNGKKLTVSHARHELWIKAAAEVLADSGGIIMQKGKNVKFTPSYFWLWPAFEKDEIISCRRTGSILIARNYVKRIAGLDPSPDERGGCRAEGTVKMMEGWVVKKKRRWKVLLEVAFCISVPPTPEPTASSISTLTNANPRNQKHAHVRRRDGMVQWLKNCKKHETLDRFMLKQSVDIWFLNESWLNKPTQSPASVRPITWTLPAVIRAIRTSATSKVTIHLLSFLIFSSYSLYHVLIHTVSSCLRLSFHECHTVSQPG